MKDYNLNNLKRLSCAFASLLIVFLSVVSLTTIGSKVWWVIVPHIFTAAISIIVAVALFYYGFVLPDLFNNDKK